MGHVSDTVIPFPVYVKGLTGNINWLKTIELACFYQVKSKTLNDLYICHKDKKRFYNYYDYYLKDIESKVDIPQSKKNVQRYHNQSRKDTTTNQEKTLPSDKLDEESKSSFSSTVSNITNQLKNIASTSNHISKVKRAIHALSVYDHEERDPTALELVSPAMGKLLDS